MARRRNQSAADLMAAPHAEAVEPGASTTRANTARVMVSDRRREREEEEKGNELRLGGNSRPEAATDGRRRWLQWPVDVDTDKRWRWAAAGTQTNRRSIVPARWVCGKVKREGKFTV